MLIVLEAVLTVLALAAVGFLRSKTKNERLLGFYDRLNKATIDGIQALESTTFREIREAAADGKIDAEERARIRTNLEGRVRVYVGEKMLKDAKDIVGVDAPAEEIATNVEAALAEALDRVASGK